MKRLYVSLISFCCLLFMGSLSSYADNTDGLNPDSWFCTSLTSDYECIVLDSMGTEEIKGQIKKTQMVLAEHKGILDAKEKLFYAYRMAAEPSLPDKSEEKACSRKRYDPKRYKECKYNYFISHSSFNSDQRDIYEKCRRDKNEYGWMLCKLNERSVKNDIEKLEKERDEIQNRIAEYRKYL